MTPHRNRPDRTFPDVNIFGASIPLAGYPPHAPPITYTSAENLYQDNAEPFEIPAEISPEYNPEAWSLVSESTVQWPGTHWNSQPGYAGEGHVQSQDQDRGADINLALTGAQTDYVPDPQVQRAFLQFLVGSRHFLQSLPDSTPCSIVKVKQAFELISLTFDQSADLDIIIQQFEPQVGTPAIRRECDLKKKDTTSTGKFII
ncbi:hypothetical protein BDN70DRAFT_934172 [Pholiota conissans]|uniref:Uncharacterized protein n=1 Tax=Pholiota conissans TaxID=109636 RepID=A0A9P5YXI2_9AGAR|nr:hypothetical protein BDN70DRAFT_934172 [Pholiota conissans]